jgi:hypothetical protein
MVHTYVLQVFYMDVTYVCNGFHAFFRCFLQVFQKHVLSVSFVFKRMLYIFYLDVSKIDQVLHMLQCHPPTAAARGGVRGQTRHRRRVGQARRPDARIRLYIQALGILAKPCDISSKIRNI